MMSYRKTKRNKQQIKAIKPSQYLNDGKVHILANKHHQIKVINWNGTAKQLIELLGANNELVTHSLLIDNANKAHFTRAIESSEPDDDYVYRAVDLNGYRIRFAKNTLLIHQINYQNAFYESKVTWINEEHLKTKYPQLIQ